MCWIFPSKNLRCGIADIFYRCFINKKWWAVFWDGVGLSVDGTVGFLVVQCLKASVRKNLDGKRNLTRVDCFYFNWHYQVSSDE